MQRPHNAYPESYRRRAEALYRKGLQQAEIGRRLGVSKATIGRWLVASGVHKPMRYRRYRVSDRARALRLYEDGHNYAEVERMTGISRWTVNRWVREAGLGRAIDYEARNDEMLRLREAGWSINDLSERYSLLESTVYETIYRTRRARRMAA